MAWNMEGPSEWRAEGKVRGGQGEREESVGRPVAMLEHVSTHTCR